MNNLKISVITVSFNASKTIEATIKSVLSQTYKNIEYIIVDGKSTDSTLKIVNKYKNKITKIVSEKDRGLYDAMNKGVKIAKGEVIYFLNADDVLKNSKVIEEVAKEFEKDNFDLVFGDVEFFYPETKQVVRKNAKASFSLIKKGIMPPHQGSFIKKKWLEKFPFNLRYKSSADYDFFCNLLKQDICLKKIDCVIARMRMGGTSSKWDCFVESESVIKNNFGFFWWFFIFTKNRFFLFIRIFLTKTGLMFFWRKINNKFKLT